MKSKKDIILSLKLGLFNADGDKVILSKSDTEWLLEYLQPQAVTPQPTQRNENYQLFYCDHCGKSFWYPGDEDPEIQRDFGYSVWYATCPTCGEEIRLTDHYWR